MRTVTVLAPARNYAVVETPAQRSTVVKHFTKYMLVEGHFTALNELLAEDGQTLLTEGGDALEIE